MIAEVDWDANTEPDLAGYHVYHGTDSGTYIPADTVTVLAPTTTYTFTGLAEGQTHFFNVTAFDTTGNESSFGIEVSKRVELAYPIGGFMIV